MLGDLAKRILDGDTRAVAQLITLIENKDERARSVLRSLYPHTGRAHVIGVTGSAGSGKSTLIARLTAAIRRRKKGVGILVVDPTSPFSGGALLGDRLRMRDHFVDEGVFIRSLATRGALGGLSSCIREAVNLLDAMGKEIVFVETIGIGQNQVEISTIARTTIVVLNPWAGDDIQGMKAGLLEIADILVVNKADVAGVDQTFHQLKALFENSGLPLLKTSALDGEGIDLLIEEMEKHRARLLASGDHRTRDRNFSRSQLLAILQERMMERALEKIGQDSLEEFVEKIVERHLDPYTAAEQILKETGMAKRTE